MKHDERYDICDCGKRKRFGTRCCSYCLHERGVYKDRMRRKRLARQDVVTNDGSWMQLNSSGGHMKKQMYGGW